MTIPPGGRGIKITGFFCSIYCSTSTAAGLAIREGTNVLNKAFITASSIAMDAPVIAYVPAPSAGAHTYTLSVENAAGTLTVQSSSSSNPGVGAPGITFILVELI